MEFKEIAKGLPKEFIKSGLIGYIDGIIKARVPARDSLRMISKAIEQYKEFK